MRAPFHLLVTLVAGAATVLACYTGPPPDRYEPARSPRGIDVDVHVRKGRLKGELLEVRDTALVLLAEGDVVLVPFARVQAAGFSRTWVNYAGGVPTRRALEHMRLLSRFPRGIQPEQLTRLLASAGHRELRVFPP